MWKCFRIVNGRRVKSVNCWNFCCAVATAIGVTLPRVWQPKQPPNAVITTIDIISMVFLHKPSVLRDISTGPKQFRLCTKRTVWNRRDIVWKWCRANTWPVIGLRAVISIRRMICRPNRWLVICKRIVIGVMSGKPSAIHSIVPWSMRTIIDYGNVASKFRIVVSQSQSIWSLSLSLFVHLCFARRERHRRYRIMREHGLLLPNHTQSWMGKVSEALCLQNGQSTTTGRFMALMQLTTAIAFDKVVEARQYQEDLKKFIFKWVLCDSNCMPCVSVFSHTHPASLRTLGCTIYVQMASQLLKVLGFFKNYVPVAWRKCDERRPIHRRRHRQQHGNGSNWCRRCVSPVEWYRYSNIAWIWALCQPNGEAHRWVS